MVDICLLFNFIVNHFFVIVNHFFKKIATFFEIFCVILRIGTAARRTQFFTPESARSQHRRQGFPQVILQSIAPPKTSSGIESLNRPPPGPMPSKNSAIAKTAQKKMSASTATKPPNRRRSTDSAS